MRLLAGALAAAVLSSCSSAPPTPPTCGTGTTACGSECADLKTSATHCGACDKACGAAESCVASMCFANDCGPTDCSPSQICGNGHCRERTCVEVTCPGGQGCLGGACVPTSCGGAECPEGQLCIGGSCADSACFGVLCPAAQTCRLGVCVAAHCSNSMTDADETDVDCGGSCAAKCRPGQGCMVAGDCAGNGCSAGRCTQAVSCTDGTRNSGETDIDCGGPQCSLRCAVGQGCVVPSDCTSMSCTGGVCVGPSCSDQRKNGTETDIDCGGVCTLRCADGQHCGVPQDCTSMSCTNAVCTTASCFDMVKNGAETDADCGGSCQQRCTVGQHCGVPVDCISMSCSGGTCAMPGCTDMVKNGTESDTDCGGACPLKCANGRMCGVPADCTSVNCVGGTCTGSACTDMVQNGTETDTDCGGNCSPCINGKRCLIAADCTSMSCPAGTCVGASCFDMVKNGSETDTDCGGTCMMKCAVGRACMLPNDCQSGVCSSNLCAGPTCFDGTRNGTETDTDCGGTCVRKCNAGQMCMVPADCLSGVCAGTTCGADPLNAGLLGYFTMNAADVNGNAMIDASGNGNTSVFIGSFASAAGQVGEAVQFVGGNSFLSVSDNITSSVALTMSVWLKTGPTGAFQYLINKWSTIGGSDGNQSFLLGVTSTGRAQCYANGLNAADLNIIGATTLTDNAWHLITCTIDKNQPGNNFIIYVDGMVDAQAVVGGNVIAQAPDPLRIGQGVYGALDDARIYNRALTNGEVQLLRGMTYPGVPMPPTGLSASAISSSQIDLAWVRSPSAGVLAYVVDRSLTGTGGWFPVAVVGGSAATFSDATLPAGKLFHYRVSAETPTGTSTPAGGASAMTVASATTYSVPSGLLAYWTGNSADINGTLEIDASGNGNTATIVGGPTAVTGKIAEALQSGSTTYLAPGTGVNPNSALTISAWINTTQTAPGYLVNKWCTSACGDADQGYVFEINATPGSGVASCYVNGLNSQDLGINGIAKVNDGNWHFLVCTVDAAGTGNNFKIYVDGVLDNDVYVGTNVMRTTTDPLRVAQSIIGLIDDIRVYGRALSPTEIHTLFNSGSMGSP